MFTALLDTCVLWPSLQRDVLLSRAVEGMYRPVWSGVILAELEYEQAAKLVRSGADPTAAQSRAAQLVAQMRRVFDDAEITGWEGLDGTYGRPDPDDEHVVAAAVVAGAGAIVTLNTKDFPAALLPSGLETCDQRTSPPTPCPWTRLARCTRFAPSPAARVRMDRPAVSLRSSTSWSTGTDSMTPSNNSAPSPEPQPAGGGGRPTRR